MMASSRTKTAPPRQLFIAAYDVACPKRLRKVLYVVRRWASGGQKSVFECFLTETERKALLADVGNLIDPLKDRFLLLKLDARCRVLTLGKAVPPQDGIFFYVG